MCHPFSSMFHHLTCLGTCWKPAPGSCCGGVGGMDGDATTPGGFERRGTFFCHGGPIGGDFNEENLWKPWGKGKNMVDFKQNWWRMSTSSTENGALVNQSTRFFLLYGWLGTFEPGRGVEAECREFAGFKMFQEKQTNKEIQSDWLERSRKIIWKI